MVVRRITSLEAAKDDIHLRGDLLEQNIDERGVRGGVSQGKNWFCRGGVELDLFHRQ